MSEQRTRVTVRRLTSGDEQVLRGLRLQALSDSPEAFGSTYEREIARSDQDWQRWLTRGATFVVEDGSGEARGLAAGYTEPDDPASVNLVSMWVDPTMRGSGAADALVREVLSWAAAEGASVIRLYVVKANGAARRLYERHGFRRRGAERVRERDGVVELQMERAL